MELIFGISDFSCQIYFQFINGGKKTSSYILDEQMPTGSYSQNENKTREKVIHEETYCNGADLSISSQSLFLYHKAYIFMI